MSEGMPFNPEDEKFVIKDENVADEEKIGDNPDNTETPEVVNGNTSNSAVEVSTDEKQDNAEEGEELKKSPIFAMYRSNEVYDANKDAILEGLLSTGRPVEIKVFPTETKERVIQTWMKNNADKINDKIVFSDTTCKPDGDKFSFVGAGSWFTSKTNFDYMFETATYNAVCEEAVEHRQMLEEEDKFEALFSIVMKKAKEKLGDPSSILVFDRFIGDHRPMRKLVAEDGTAEEPLKYIKNLLIESGFSENDIKTDLSSAEDVEKGKEWNDKERLERINNAIEEAEQNSWVIIDRHAVANLSELREDEQKDISHKQKLEWEYGVTSFASTFPNNVKIFLLPAESLVHSALGQEIIEVDEEEYKKALSSTIKLYFNAFEKKLEEELAKNKE